MDHQNYNKGFTLIELITTLIITGIISSMIGSGIIYTTKLYKFTKSTDEVILQASAAFNLIRQKIQQGELAPIDNDTSCNQGPLRFANSNLYWNDNIILSNVEHCQFKTIPAFSSLPSEYSATVQELSIEIAVGEATKSFVLTTYGTQ